MSNLSSETEAAIKALGGQNTNYILNLSNSTTMSTDGKEEEPEAINNTLNATDSIIKKYGIIQDILIKSKKEDPLIKARRILNENCKPKESIEVECIGDINYKVGYGVHLVAPFLKGYEDCFMYIKEVEYEWKNDSLFTSKLTLTKSRVMDEVEWNDLDDDDSTDSSTAGSDLWEKIYALLKQQEGKPYVYGATGPDSFDCSGLVQYCYNQYKDELGFSLLRVTNEQCKQGSEVDKTNKDAWNPGDLLFWYASPPYPGHVSIYIGGDKMTHAPHTGDVVKTVDVSRTDIYCVRRVIPDYATAGGMDYSGDIPTPEFTYQGLNSTQKSWLNKMSEMCIKASLKYPAIFASVAIAQSIEESGWGQTIPSGSNNYFGVKADSRWTGPSVNGWRKYDNPEQSVLDRYNFLLKNSNYKKSGTFDAKTPYDQLVALEDAGYCEGDKSYYVSKVWEHVTSHNLLAADEVVKRLRK